ncbi:MAG: phytanoyl-CoA dioxygenase family protein [Pseudomonadales bacterium]|nr:phytanoyl-CoA dioxygenase family protein [Pseudomonadales bacterium]
MRRGFGLTDGEHARYADEGFLIRTCVFGPAEVEGLRAAAEATVESVLRLCAKGCAYLLDGKRFVDVAGATVQFEHAVGSGTVRVIEPAHLFDPRWESLIDDPRIVEPVADLVGADAVALWTDKLNLKRPMEGSGFRWHQDSPYWIHDCTHVDRLPNVMVLLDDASEANGALRMIPGSHRAGRLPGTDDGTQLGGFYTDPDCFSEAAAVAMVAPAGSLVFFSPHVVHGSPPNRSAQQRRALILTYQPAGYRMLKLPRVRNAGG